MHASLKSGQAGQGPWPFFWVGTEQKNKKASLSGGGSFKDSTRPLHLETLPATTRDTTDPAGIFFHDAIPGLGWPGA